MTKTITNMENKLKFLRNYNIILILIAS